MCTWDAGLPTWAKTLRRMESAWQIPSGVPANSHKSKAAT